MKSNNLLGRTGIRETAHRLRTMVFAALFASLTVTLARADLTYPLKYSGGPVAGDLTISALYYGSGWTQTEIDAQQTYLQKLAVYLSGYNNPQGHVSMMLQYGVHSASVSGGAARMNPADPPHHVAKSELLQIIHTAQQNNLVLPYGPNRLIIVFFGHGFINGADSGCPYHVTTTGQVVDSGLCGYHGSESTSKFFATVPADSGPSLAMVSAHEIFEAAADPAINQNRGWDEAVDNCSTSFNIYWIDMVNVGGLFIPKFYSAAVPGAHDNTLGGACSTTGFTTRPFPLPTTCGIMKANQAIVGNTPQEKLSSCDGRFSLQLSGLGYLAVIGNSLAGKSLWTPYSGSAFTYNSGTMAVMQADGNFVLYRGFVTDPANAVWSSGTSGHPGAYLAMQNDGNLVVYDVNSKPLWASNTCCY